MNIDAILFDALHTLYPQVTMDTGGIVLMIFYMVLVGIAVAMFIVFMKDGEHGIGFLLFIFAVFFLGVSYCKHSESKDKAIDRMIQLLVSDPPALEKVMSLKDSLEWINDPVRQRSGR